MEFNIEEFEDYQELVRECLLPTKVLKEGELGVKVLDHYVFCAKNFYQKDTCDEFMKKHCEEIWTKWNTQEVTQSIINCISLISNSISSQNKLMRTKLVHRYLKDLALGKNKKIVEEEEEKDQTF
jgi:uridine phosphorylase